MSEWMVPERDDYLEVRVDAIDSAGPRSTVAIGLGVDAVGRRVTFAGSSWEMARIAAALGAGEEPVALVPRFAVLTASNPDPDA